MSQKEMELLARLARGLERPRALTWLAQLNCQRAVLPDSNPATR